MIVDPFVLAALPRGLLTIISPATPFTCVLCGCEQEPYAYRVTLPCRVGKACPGCANDRGWAVG